MITTLHMCYKIAGKELFATGFISLFLCYMCLHVCSEAVDASCMRTFDTISLSQQLAL